jgi:hypothetical protein
MKVKMQAAHMDRVCFSIATEHKLSSGETVVEINEAQIRRAQKTLRSKTVIMKTPDGFNAFEPLEDGGYRASRA